MPELVDCWITLELRGWGGGCPTTDCKEKDNWSFSLIGSPDKGNTRDESVQTSYERQNAAVTEQRQRESRYIYMYLYSI